MSRRATLAELREIVLDELDGQWVTTSEITDALDLDHGPGWYRVALTLERLANDGLAELKTPGSTVRRFRRSRGHMSPLEGGVHGDRCHHGHSRPLGERNAREETRRAGR